MDLTHFGIEWLIEQRLADARAASARHALLTRVRPRRPGMLARIGLALIRIERRLRSHGSGRRRARPEPLLGLP